jgi:two-component system chemotaxis response regulator CheY
MPAAAAIKVMVVDDQTSMRAMIRRALQDLGFKDVRDKPSAPEALSAIKTDRVHLIISDFNMPEMDGLQFLEAVRTDPSSARPSSSCSPAQPTRRSSRRPRRWASTTMS